MKLKPFQQYLKQQNIDLVFLIHPDSNITYFIQMKPSYAHLIITPNSAELQLTKLDHHPKIKNIATKNFKKNWDTELGSKKTKKVGINKTNLSAKFFEKLQKIFPKAKFVDVSDKLNLLRSQKTDEEAEKISKACQITTDAFNKLIDSFSAKRFKTEQDVAFFLERHIKERGAELAFPTICASGKNSSVPHHQTSNFRLRRGFLQIDFGACYQNYCADMSRVLHLGAIGKGEKRRYNILLNAQQEAVRHASLDKPFHELDNVARKNLGRYSSYFIHSLGHGVGVDVHEQPSFSEEARQTIKKNHVFTIEPGIYFPGKYGLRVEDTLLSDKKMRILTKAGKELVILS